MQEHFLQMKMSKKLEKYKKSIWDDSKMYDLSNLKIPFRIQRGEKDEFLEQSVQNDRNFILKTRTSNGTIHTIPNYGHSAPVLGVDVSRLVFDDILKVINYEKQIYYGPSGACATKPTTTTTTTTPSTTTTTTTYSTSTATHCPTRKKRQTTEPPVCECEEHIHDSDEAYEHHDDPDIADDFESSGSCHCKDCNEY